ncbi:MAG TPA: hypothetical protein VHN73_00295, partial [Phenylobacterium sp.]|nr:hypothetical protein [Phenylobacterium sp.]
RPDTAAEILAAEYPFTPLENVGRRYTIAQSMRVFLRDGFTDRYTGKRLIFPGTLRLLSQLLPDQFPFHNNWKTDACHFGYYELFPTIDHLVPVSRGGADGEDNWVSTSMLKNAAKANFTIEELGWTLHPPGDPAIWDGLAGWFVRYLAIHPEEARTPYLRQWARVAVCRG